MGLTPREWKKLMYDVESYLGNTSVNDTAAGYAIYSMYY